MLDVIFSLDSVITAVGMADQIAIMLTAVILAGGDDVLSETHQFLHHPTSDSEGPGAVVLAPDWGSFLGEGVGMHISQGSAITIAIHVFQNQNMKRELESPFEAEIPS